METIKPRITALLKELRSGIYDKDQEMSMALLAALSGESILLLGPPGVAKSMIARRMKTAFTDASSFEYLMSRFSTPDEIFGPISIRSLKISDKYERATEGFLPSADVVFLDEIWKAGPAIQNTLLTVMNEKLFRNGNEEIRIPLKLMIAASNELPAQDEGLEALWDRFLIRMLCGPISNEKIFRLMLTDSDETDSSESSCKESINQTEYDAWHTSVKKVRIPEEVFDAITTIRQSLRDVSIEDSELTHSVYISDRRWKHIINLLRTSAWLQDREEVDLTDLLPIKHCLWNNPKERNAIALIVREAIFHTILHTLSKMEHMVEADVHACEAKYAMQRAVRMNDHREDSLAVTDRFFYAVEGHGSGNTRVFITDFKNMAEHGKGSVMKGCIYTDPIDKKRRIVRCILPEWDGTAPVSDKEFVTLCRDDRNIYINGVPFRLKQSLIGETEIRNQTAYESSSYRRPVSSLTYEDDAENLCQKVESLMKRIENNLFSSPDDLTEGRAIQQQVFSRVASMRVGIRKLLYDE